VAGCGECGDEPSGSCATELVSCGDIFACAYGVYLSLQHNGLQIFTVLYLWYISEWFIVVIDSNVFGLHFDPLKLAAWNLWVLLSEVLSTQKRGE
jgi:hypothetical protein